MKKRIGESPLKFFPGAGAIAGGAVKAGIGLIGGGKRKRELERARKRDDTFLCLQIKENGDA